MATPTGLEIKEIRIRKRSIDLTMEVYTNEDRELTAWAASLLLGGSQNPIRSQMDGGLTESDYELIEGLREKTVMLMRELKSNLKPRFIPSNK